MCTPVSDTKDATEHTHTSVKEDEVLATQNDVGVALRPGLDKEKNIMDEGTKNVQRQKDGDQSFEASGSALQDEEKIDCVVLPASQADGDIAQDQPRRSGSSASLTDNEAGTEGEHGQLIPTRRSFKGARWCKGFTNRFTGVIMCLVLAFIFLIAAWAMVALKIPETAKITGDTPAPFSCGGAVSAHKALFPGENRSSSLELSSLTFDPLNDDPGTEHACSIMISNNSFVITEPGEYFVYFSLQIDMNVMHVFPGEVRIQGFVFLERPNSPAHTGMILGVGHTVCPKCQDKKTLYSRRSVQLQAGDRLVVRGPGPKVIDFIKTSTFLGATKRDLRPVVL